MKYKNINRRNFLGVAGCGAMGYTTLFSTLFNLKTMNAASIANSAVYAGGGYKALVCFFMGGGNDSFNMLIPKGNQTEYDHYDVSRSNLSIAQDDILSLNGTDYGLHPAMTGLQGLYNSGKVSFVANTGTLVEYVDDKYQVWDELKDLPLGLYSHADQGQQWQTGIPHERSAVGWGGKIGDLLGDMNTNQDIALNISLAGNNIYQTGNATSEFTISPYNGAITINGYDEDWLFSEMRTQGIDNMIEANYVNQFKQTYIDIIKVSRDANLQFQEAFDGVSLSTVFSDNYASMNMETVAKTIAIREDLGMTRQIFFVDYGGWDHHDEVLDAQNELLGEVDAALTEFQAAMEELGIADCVTTFTVSEFARTLTSNGNGTDHGWGGNVLIMGGDVNGGQIFGTYPSLELHTDIDIGGGVLIPSTSCDEYFAELAMWFGVEPAELSTLFPNIGNFYDTGSGDMPIGFLNT